MPHRPVAVLIAGVLSILGTPGTGVDAAPQRTNRQDIDWEQFQIRVAPLQSASENAAVLETFNRYFEPTRLIPSIPTDLASLSHLQCGRVDSAWLALTRRVNSLSSTTSSVDAGRQIQLPACPRWTLGGEAKILSDESFSDLLQRSVGTSGPGTRKRVGELNEKSATWDADAVTPGESFKLPYVSVPHVYTLRPEFAGRAGAVRAELAQQKGVQSAEPASTVELVGATSGTCEPGAANGMRLDTLADLLERNARFRAIGRKATVAIIDTGIDRDESRLPLAEVDDPDDLKDNDGNGWIDDRFGANSDRRPGFPTTATTYEDRNHGTHVAGLATGGDESRRLSALVRDRVQLRIVNIVTRETPRSRTTGLPTEAFSIPLNNLVNAFVYTRLDPPAPIIHLSIESSVELDSLRPHLQAGDFLTIVAAGNSGQDLFRIPSYPARYAKDLRARLIAVAALDSSNALASFSNFGADYVDLAAHGCQVNSLLPAGGSGAMSGTSQAAPQVTFAAALLYAEGFGPQRIRDRLRASAVMDAGLIGKVRYGRFDILRTLAVYDDLVTTESGEVVSGRIIETKCIRVDLDCEGLSGLARYLTTSPSTVRVSLYREDLAERATSIPSGALKIEVEDRTVREIPWSTVRDVLFALRRR